MPTMFNGPHNIKIGGHIVQLENFHTREQFMENPQNHDS